MSEEHNVQLKISNSEREERDNTKQYSPENENSNKEKEEKEEKQIHNTFINHEHKILKQEDAVILSSPIAISSQLGENQDTINTCSLSSKLPLDSNLTKYYTGAYENQGRQIVFTPKAMNNDNEIEKKKEQGKKKNCNDEGESIQEYLHTIDPSTSNAQIGGIANQQNDQGLNPTSSGGGSWLEEIQFKAQYQHFRSMDYASIVNSTPSLDRVVETETSAPEAVNNIRIGSLCWNFPRVNLRRLFNAKSLEDILGRSSRKGSHESQLKNAHHSQSNSNLSSSRDGRGHYSNSNSKLISVTPPVLSTASSENNCYNKGVKSHSGSTFLKVPISSCSTKTKIARKSENLIQRVKCAKSDNCLHRMVTTACTKLVSSSVDNLDTERTSDWVEQGKPDNNVSSDKFAVKLNIPVKTQVRQLEEDLERKQRVPLEQQQQIADCSSNATATILNSAGSSNTKKAKQKLVVTKVSPPKKSQVSPGDVGCDIMTKQKMKESNVGSSGLKANEKNVLNCDGEGNLYHNKNKNVAMEGKTTTNMNNDNNKIDTVTVMTNEKPRLVVANVTYLQIPVSPTAPFLLNTSQNQFNVPIPCPSSNRSELMSPPTILPGSSQLSTNNTNTTNVFRSNFYASDGSRNNIFSLSSPSDKYTNSSFSYNNYNQKQQYPFQCSTVKMTSTTTAPDKQQQQRNSRTCFHKSDEEDYDVGNYFYSTGISRQSRSGPEIHPEQINNNAPGPFDPFQQHHRLQSKCDYSLGREGYKNYPRSKSTERPQRDSTTTSYQLFNQGAVTDTSRRRDREIGERMGDLQSPSYVKRTARMFDTGHIAGSRQVNGAAKDYGKDESKNGSSQNQPSYLNISRSVCGYSYNGTAAAMKVKNMEGLLDLKENIRGRGEPEEKNGEYFLNVIRHEKSRIEGLIESAETRLGTLDSSSEESADYELSGKILAAIGKARLLVNKKFKQFEGLCNDNIEQRKKGVGSDEPYSTKNEDLEGFWDMVLIQVDQIHSMFKNLDGSEGTKTIASKGPKPGSTKKSAQKVSPTATIPPKSTMSKSGTSRDELRRKMLAERRQAMKNQMAAQQALAPTDPDVQEVVMS